MFDVIANRLPVCLTDYVLEARLLVYCIQSLVSLLHMAQYLLASMDPEDLSEGLCENGTVRFILNLGSHEPTRHEMWSNALRNSRLFKQHHGSPRWRMYVEVPSQSLHERCPALFQDIHADRKNASLRLRLINPMVLVPVFASLFPELLDEACAISRYSFCQAKNLWESALELEIPLLAHHAAWIMVMR